MFRHQPYLATKNSGIDWLREVPNHWSVLPGRACFCEKKQPNVGLQEKIVLSLSYGQVIVKPPERLHGLVPSSFETYQIVNPMDIVSRPIDLQTSLNGFPSGQIAAKVREDPYRFLVCADKFQTGYDEPLLHTMYVDKTLSDIKAVQTLSRLNRAHPEKHDVFVLDFLNDADTIRDAFADFYRATILARETDPDKLHDLQADLDGAQVYSPGQIDDFVERYLGGADRDQLDPILDACVAVYVHEMDEDSQVDFKGKVKAFVRTYAFLSCVLPYTNAEWEKRSIFLNFLISKLPAPDEEDLSKGILDAIDMDSYRVEKRAVQKIMLPDEDAEIGPVPPSGGGERPEPELERLSNILKAFNDLFGNIAWQDLDRVGELITKTIPAQVAADSAFRNARQNSDDANARIEHDKALERVVTRMVNDDAELFKQFVDNEDFRRWMTAHVFKLACEATPAA